MKIYKVLNNNVAIIKEADGAERIVMGKGICYGKKNGEEIPASVIDKIFTMSNKEADTKFRQLIQDVPLEHIELGERIISQSELRLGKKLNEMIYISLIDHIYTSVIRF